VEIPVEQIQGKHLLIDGDLILYKCGFALDSLLEKGEEVPSKEDFLKVVFDSIEQVTQPTSMEVFLSGPQNFRDIIATTQPYKGNRKDDKKPKYFKELKEILKTKYAATISKGCEADDSIGVLLTEDPKGRVCVSFDKDLFQISGYHYDWRHHQARWLSRKAGDFNLFSQVVAGDPTDNVPGLRGYGAIKAAKVLEGAGSSKELCQRAWNEYKLNGHNRAYFEEQARLVYILREWDLLLPPAFGQINYDLEM
jgi:DNA polymerase I